MRIQVNKVHYPVTALGPGRRIGIWLQGCSIGCSGCISRDTWRAGLEYETTVDQLLTQCEMLAPGEIDGATVSGGEPFEQPAALEALVAGLSARRARQSAPFDILVYSGLRLERLRRMHGAILGSVDAVISEPFVAAKAPGGRWCGSSNQVLTTLTPLGEQRYSHGGAATEHSAARRVQVSVDGDHIWLIGVPRPGEMLRLERSALARGLHLGTVSWRA